MKKAKGITLIALVVTIIIMLILAGVSLNAITGDGGLIANAMRASFIQEMTAVQEAVDMWRMSKKFDDLEDISLPTEKIVEANTLEENKRLMGEVGYYRVWAVTSEKPAIDVKSDEDTFKSAGSAEIIFYPAGVQDLYYLDNEVLGLEKNNKKYLIDAENSMIYSLSGISIEGIRIHSLPMLRMLQGATDAPKFAEAEAEGGSGIFAGSKWLTDKDGHYIDENGNIVDEANRVENPYGFEIIGDYTNDNIYKLYNNGDLYGKGKKGFLLNSKTDELEKINQYVWKSIELPSNIPGASSNNVEIYPGCGAIFIVDSERNLWAYGDNTDNIMGLSKEEQVEFMSAEIRKLNIFGKKVYKIFPSEYATYIITENNGEYELYAAGYNTDGELGIGNTNTSQNSFTKVKFDHPEKITNISCRKRDSNHTLILTSDGKCYFAGEKSELNFIFNGTDLSSTTYITEFVEIFNDKYGKNLINSKITGVYCAIDATARDFLLTDDGHLYLINSSKISEEEFDGELGNVKKYYDGCSLSFVKRVNESGEEKFWAKFTINEQYFNPNFFGKDVLNNWIDLTSFFDENGIDEKQVEDIHYVLTNSSNGRGAVFISMKDGKVFALGDNKSLGVNISATENKKYKIKNINEACKLQNIDRIVYNSGDGYRNETFLLENQGKYYVTNDLILMYRDNVLQQNWTSVAKNVKKFNASTWRDSLAYIDKNNDLWILGQDSSYLRNK